MVIEDYLNRALEEHQRILTAHFDLKALYTKELESLAQMAMIKRFDLRSELDEPLLNDVHLLERLDLFLRPLFNQPQEKVYNLNLAFLKQQSLRRPQAEDEEWLDFDQAAWQEAQLAEKKRRLQLCQNVLEQLLSLAVAHDGEITLGQLPQLAGEEMAHILPTVEIFKEVIIELLKSQLIEISALRQERQANIGFGGGYMSRLNGFRVVNLNYNNNAIRVDDELWRFNGESTLLSLRNGGGKTVLVQMLTALFVHKRYRNTKDRPFSSYFTTNKPTFLMAEWALDDKAGYVLIGMMVRQHQVTSEEDDSGEELDMVNFICEYDEPNPYDIQNLPIITHTSGGKKLKGFSTCKELFGQWKNNKAMKFFAYDMNYPAQARAYFEQLEEYQIYYKEWENIIYKINAQESGLSNLFDDCKDERGLVEKWFLDAVETG